MFWLMWRLDALLADEGRLEIPDEALVYYNSVLEYTCAQVAASVESARSNSSTSNNFTYCSITLYCTILTCHLPK